MRWSIRYQLLLPVLVVLLGVVGLGVLVAIRTTQQAVRRQIESQLGQVARSLGEATFPFTKRVLEQLKDLTGAEYLLLGADGRSLATLPEISPDVGVAIQPAADWPDVRLNDSIRIAGQNYLAAKVSLRHGGLESGNTLYVFYPEDRWRAALGEALYPALATGLAGGFASVALALLVAHWLTRRVRALERQTRQIATGDFRAMPLPAWNDELRDLAASINAMANQLAQWQESVRKAERLRLLGQVSGGLVHQLRNGMTGARLAVQVHLRAGSAGEVDAQGLEVALRQLTLVDEKLQRFLRLGRDDKLSCQPCSLAQLIDEALTLLRPSYQHARIDLRWQPPASALMMLGDVGRLGHLLLNVLGNAAEAAGPNGWVEVRARSCADDTRSVGSDRLDAAQRHAVIEVIDSGPGPAPEVADRLFEEFVTSKPEGMGLGLAVAREVALAHGGSIDWRRENGQTCFYIRFPLLESGMVRATTETAPTS